MLLLATGSEVSLCVAAYETLRKEGIKARVVSMPCWELFERQSDAYRDGVLPPSVTARVAVEQASIFGRAHYVGPDGGDSGVHAFDPYRVDQSVPLMSDFFVPDDDVPPPGVTVRALPSAGQAQKSG